LDGEYLHETDLSAEQIFIETFALLLNTSTSCLRSKMAPRPSKTNDRAKSTGGAGKRKLDFMQEEEDDDYEVVKAHRGGDDSDEEVAKDISSALVGGPSSRQLQDDGYGTEEEEAEIASMMGSKLKADGMTAVKAHAAKGKGKEKETKGLTGGGSWQSMGEIPKARFRVLRKTGS